MRNSLMWNTVWKTLCKWCRDTEDIKIFPLSMYCQIFCGFLNVIYHEVSSVRQKIKIRSGNTLKISLANFEIKGLSLNLLRIIVSIEKKNHYLLDLLNPEIHSSKNSKVRCGSLAARVLLIETIKRVLLAGIHKPDVSSNWPSIFKLKVQVKAHRRL